MNVYEIEADRRTTEELVELHREAREWAKVGTMPDDAKLRKFQAAALPNNGILIMQLDFAAKAVDAVLVDRLLAAMGVREAEFAINDSYLGR